MHFLKYIVLVIIIIMIIFTMGLAIKEKDYSSDRDERIVINDAGTRDVLIHKELIIFIQICELIAILCLLLYNKKDILSVILSVVIFLIINCIIFFIPIKKSYDVWYGGERNTRYINIYNYTLKNE